MDCFERERLWTEISKRGDELMLNAQELVKMGDRGIVVERLEQLVERNSYLKTELEDDRTAYAAHKLSCRVCSAAASSFR